RNDLAGRDEYVISDDEGPFMDSTQYRDLYSKDFFLAVPGCDLTEVSLARWRETIRAAVEEELDEIEKDARRRAEAAGFSRVSEGARGPLDLKDDGTDDKYYDWFVSFHLGGESYKQI